MGYILVDTMRQTKLQLLEEKRREEKRREEKRREEKRREEKSD